jgi:hypothetical protein
MEGSGGKESINTLILNQNVFESTLRLNGSPSKGSVLPSPRYFISPNKNRELVVDQKLKRFLIRLKLPEKYYKLVINAIY